MSTQQLFQELGLGPQDLQGALAVHSPIDGVLLAHVRVDDVAALDRALAQASQAFLTWRSVPAPKRGELVRRFGEQLRLHKQALGTLVSLECGKILQEG